MEMCPTHPDLESDYYCLLCDKAVCQKCGHENHGIHEVQSLEVFVQSKQHILRTLVEKANNETLPQLTELLDANNKCMDEYKMTVSALKIKITNRTREIQEAAEEILKAQISHLEEETNSVIDGMAGRERDIKTQIEKVKSRLESIQSDALNANTLTKDERDLEKITNIRVDRRLPTPPKFYPSTEKEINKVLKTLLGKFEKQDTKQQSCVGEVNAQTMKVSTNMSTKVVKAIATRRGQKVTSICQSSSNEVIVAYNSCNCVDYFDMNGRKTKSRKVPIGVQDIASVRDGELIVTLNNGSKVIKVEKDKTDEVVDLSPFITLGLKASEDRSVMVCLWDGSHGKIVKLSPAGKIAKEISHSSTGETLFVKPYRLVLGNSGIIVADSGKKSVIAVDDSNCIQFIYSGGSEKKSFIPIGLACSGNGRIMVANWKGNSVHLINNRGDLLALVIEQKHNILYPFALGLDSIQRLWVGHKDNITIIKF